MKTKTKVLAIVQIAVVLCSVFLVAIPAIAADQNQEMQEVSTSEVTTTSKDDYALGIYGNANEDDTIDMGDVVYTKLAIFGKKPKTELCDAKYDGRINVLDVIQTKLIILGKEKELTIIDAAGEVITVNKPVKRIVTIMYPSAEVLRALNAADMIVGVGGSGIGDNNLYFPELSKLPSVGKSWFAANLDYEAILNLNPDVVMPFGAFTEKEKEKLPGVTVIYLGLRFPVGFPKNVRKLGYIIDKKDEAEEFVKWWDGHMDTIKSRTEGFSEDKKPKVYLEMSPGGGAYRSAGKTSRYHQMCVIAGGKNIVEDLEGHWIKVEREWVMKQNPDIIVAGVTTKSVPCGYGVDDPSGMAAAREDIMNRPELAKVAAVKNGNVYMMLGTQCFGTGPRTLMGTAYQAKWFHPTLFEDLDPKAIHQEYLTRFQGLDVDLDEKGVFVYHPEEHPDGS